MNRIKKTIILIGAAAWLLFHLALVQLLTAVELMVHAAVVLNQASNANHSRSLMR